MLPQIFIAIAALYLVFTLLLWCGWRRLKNTVREPVPTMPVTVVIAVRNEEENILNLVKDLECQSFPGDLFEVVIVDDHSEDDTVETILAYLKNANIDVKIHHLKEETSAPKKAAINMGVLHARGDIIMVTDGDCRVGKNWIANTAGVFEAKDARFVTGPVAFVERNSFLHKLMSIEFSSLIGSGAAFMFFKRPVMCNAANLAFDQKTFVEIGGFDGNEQNASGDDVFLMRKFFERYPEQVFFNKDEEVVVKTYAERSLTKFYNQRVRWVGKWKKVSGVENKIVPVLVFLIHLSFLTAVVFFIAGQLSLLNLIIVIALRFSGEYLFLQSVMEFGGNRASFIHYFTASLLYPFYAVALGFMANFGRYHWKGRKYKE